VQHHSSLEEYQHGGLDKMWGVQNTSNEILSIHTLEVDADASLTRLGGAPLVVVEDTNDNLIAALKQDL